MTETTTPPLRTGQALEAYVKERFDKDVATHTMTVVLDQDLHRHLQFRRPGTRGYWFDVITWPGTFVIDGDMGTFIFRRERDMFEFFRSSAPTINPMYWAEKCVAGVTEEFSMDSFTSTMQTYLDEYIQYSADLPDPEDLEPEEVKERDATIATIRADFTNDVLKSWATTEGEVYDLLSQYNGPVQVGDSCDWHFRDYTFHFLWCCYALRWAIREYDKTVGPTLDKED